MTMKRAVLATAFSLTLAAPLLEAQSAGTVPKQRTPRRLVYGLIGAGVGAAAAGFYMSVHKDGVTPGLCSQNSCMLTFSLGLGTLVGYTVGREFDQLHALRYRGRAALRPVHVSAGLSGEPTLLAVRDSLVVVGGPGGLQVFTSQAGLRPAGTRAAGIRGISALDIGSRSAALVVGSASGFYLYPPQSGPGLLVREGEATAAAAAGDRFYLGVASRIEVVPADADTSGGWPGVEAGGRVITLAWDAERTLLWALVDSSLVAFRPAGDSLERVGTLAVGTGARRLAISGHRIAVASAENGAQMVDAADPARPLSRWRWTDARYVYDVSLAGERMYVASGIEGVFVLDVSGAEPSVIGLARELGFATALAADREHTFVLDRSTNALRRFPSTF